MQIKRIATQKASDNPITINIEKVLSFLIFLNVILRSYSIVAFLENYKSII